MDKSLECRNSKTSKLRFKGSDSARNLRNHKNKRWGNQSKFGHLASGKCIVNIEDIMHVHIRALTDTIEGYPRNYCAVFDFSASRNHPDRGSYGEWYPKASFTLVKPDVNTLELSSKADDLHQPMLIGIISISKKRQAILSCPVWLQALNRCPLAVCQVTNVPGSIFIEETFLIPYGELDVSTERRVLKDVKLPYQMVKGRPQVAAAITDNQGQVGRQRFTLMKPDQVLSCFSLSYNPADESIDFSLLEPLNRIINGFEVLFCSAEFEERAIKRMHSKTIQWNEHIV